MAKIFSTKVGFLVLNTMVIICVLFVEISKVTFEHYVDTTFTRSVSLNGWKIAYFALTVIRVSQKNSSITAIVVGRIRETQF